MADEVTLQCTLNKPNLPTINAEQLAYVLIEANPADSIADAQMPLNLTLILDHSGSMGGQKLHNMKEAVKLILDLMQPQDYVSLVIFDDRAQIVCSSQPVTGKTHLKSLVDGISDRGGTEMAKGMQLGLDEAGKALGPTRVSRILLLTDGQTYGDEDQCRRIATKAGQLGVPITALGLGEDWNLELLDAIAKTSGGVCDYIDTPSKIQPVFQEALHGMQATVVKNALLTLRLVRDVTARNAWRVVPVISQLSTAELSDRDVQVRLGELEKEIGQAVLVELKLPPRRAGSYRIAQAEVAYDVPAAGTSGEKARSDILLAFTDDTVLAQQYDSRVMNFVEKVTAFNLQTRALKDAQAGNLAGATTKLKAAATILLNMGETELATTAEAEANRLQQGQDMSAHGTKRLHYGTQKLTRKLS